DEMAAAEPTESSFRLSNLRESGWRTTRNACMAGTLVLASILAGVGVTVYARLASHPTPMKRFACPEGRFTVKLPGDPTLQTQSAPSPVGPMTMYLYALEPVHAEVHYAVGYADIPATYTGRLDVSAGFN